MLVHKHLKRAKRRQAKYADQKSKDTSFNIGDPVYYKNFRKTSKLQSNWRPYFRIIEQKGPVSFVINDQLSGQTVKAHAEQLRLANIEEWEIPKGNSGRNLRQTAYVVPPNDPDSNSSDESEMKEQPTQKIIKRRRQERDASTDEDDIPLMELAKRLKERDARNKAVKNTHKLTSGTESDDSNPESDGSYISDDKMSINALFGNLKKPKPHGQSRRKSKQKTEKDRNIKKFTFGSSRPFRQRLTLLFVLFIAE